MMDMGAWRMNGESGQIGLMGVLALTWIVCVAQLIRWEHG
jgi:hypothetical protein